jgi:hypothetical protein
MKIAGVLTSCKHCSYNCFRWRATEETCVQAEARSGRASVKAPCLTLQRTCRVTLQETLHSPLIWRFRSVR